jgi:4-amino-4-deoxy-L-arabinose transferase-like glycosyltransferase
VQAGLAQWHGKGIAGTATSFGGNSQALQNSDNDPNHSPLWYLIEAAPLAIFHVSLTSTLGNWLARAPYILIGMLLGASLWYVSRRLYGNAGGYTALLLYCFSPAVIRSSVLWLAEPNVAGAWGTFGAVFTAIAVSHTLYAPREVILWNWRRIVLLGISLALAVGSQFSLAIIIPVLLAFMLYVAWERRAAAVAILAAACIVGLALLFSSYFFHARLFWNSLAHAKWLDASSSALTMKGVWLLVLKEAAASGPVLVLLGPAALVAYIAWRRTRYFGNTAPLLVCLLFLGLRAGSPHEADSIYVLICVVFLFLFIAGIAADFLETRFREPVFAVLAGLLGANALWNLIGLARVGR